MLTHFDNSIICIPHDIEWVAYALQPLLQRKYITVKYSYYGIVKTFQNVSCVYNDCTYNDGLWRSSEVI